jgi:peptidoglycan hydrolase CwlO-like protein
MTPERIAELRKKAGDLATKRTKLQTEIELLEKQIVSSCNLKSIDNASAYLNELNAQIKSYDEAIAKRSQEIEALTDWSKL